MLIIFWGISHNVICRVYYVYNTSFSMELKVPVIYTRFELVRRCTCRCTGSLRSLTINRYSIVLIARFMMTSSNGAIFCITGPLWGEFTGEFPHQGQWRGALMFYLNKHSSKQSRRRWFETPSRSLLHHCNEVTHVLYEFPSLSVFSNYLFIRWRHSNWTTIPSKIPLYFKR